MANPQAGWYADPSGDLTKLRYWNGEQWTEHYTDALQAVQTPQPSQSAVTAQPAAAAAPVQAAQPAAAQPAAPQSAPAPQPTPAPQADPAAHATYQPAAQPVQPVQPTMPQNPYAQAAPTASYEPTFAMSETDRTMRLVAFVFCIISTVCAAMLIIPLAWMIPMSLYSGKSTRARSPTPPDSPFACLSSRTLLQASCCLSRKKT